MTEDKKTYRAATVIAFDPGGAGEKGATGYALWNGELLRTGSFPHFEMVDDLVGLADNVIIERPFSKPTTDTIVFQVYGVCRERAWSKKKLIYIQEPSVPKAVYMQYNLCRKLKGMSGQHPKDAFMHLLFWMEKYMPVHLEEVLRQAKGEIT